MKDSVRVGFTGTQHGMTPEQKREVHKYLHQSSTPISIFHHGDCIGADAEAAAIAASANLLICSHPPLNESKRAHFKSDIVWDAKDYLDRNQDIVDNCDVLLACPKEDVEQVRSGTWATIRRARKASVKILIILPHGGIWVDE